MARMTRADPPSELPRHLVSLMQSEFPTSRPQDAVVIGVGFDVVAWRVPDPTGDWALRVPRHAPAIEVIEAQTTLMHHIEEHGLPVPREARMIGDGASRCSLYRFAEGRHAIPEDRAREDRLAAQLADILNRLHRVPIEALPARVVRPIEDRFGPIIERCRPHLEGARRRWLDAVETRLGSLIETAPPIVLVHADLKPEHVILGGDGTIEALLDFEGIQVSDPAIDLSRIIQHWGRPLAEVVLESYTGAVDAHFLERAQLYRDLDGVELLDTVIEDGAEEWREVALREIDAAERRGVDALNPPA